MTKCIQIYREQEWNGLYYMHEKPRMADSWRREDMRRLMSQKGCKEATRRGKLMREAECDEERGEGLEGEVRIISNAEELIKVVKGIEEGEVKEDEAYEKVMKGLKRQMQKDGRMTKDIGCSMCAIDEVRHWEEAQRYWDDLSGKELNTERVMNARREELEEFRKHRVYDKVPEEERGGMLEEHGTYTYRNQVG